MMIMGADPGEQTGIAVYRDGRLAQLSTIRPAQYGAVLADFLPDMLVIEDSRLQSHVFTGPKESPAARLKIARNVGMVDGYCALMTQIAESLDIPVVPVSPLRKGSKLNAKQFNSTTKWAGKSNQHERDAAMVAYQYRLWGRKSNGQ